MEQEILDQGYQILAVSPDTPEELKQKVEKTGLTYRLLSDSTMAAAKAFGLAWKLDEDMLSRYKGFGIDLGKSSGGGNADLLPVPAFYLVSSDGAITFAHHDPDYTERISSEDIRAALAAK